MNQSDLSNEAIDEGEGTKVIRVKEEYLEETSLPTTTSTNVAESMSGENTPATVLLNPGATPNNIDIDTLLEVPEAKALLSSFPPGCICLRVDSNPAALNAVTLGSIRGVFVDLNNKSSAGTFVYRFSPEPPFHHEGEALVRETELRLGPSCPVWARPVHADPEEDQLPAVVIGSYVRPEGVFYSVHDVIRNAQYDGVPVSSIRYRPDDVSILSQGSSEMRPMIATPSSLARKTVFSREDPTDEQVRELPTISPQSSEELRPSKKSKKADESGCEDKLSGNINSPGLDGSSLSMTNTGHRSEISSSARELSSSLTSSSHERNDRTRKETITFKVVLPRFLVPDDVKGKWFSEEIFEAYETVYKI
jgi:hypothetical protein